MKTLPVILNEKKYAQSALQPGFRDTRPARTANILARYYAQHLGYDSGQIRLAVHQYLSLHEPRYKTGNWEKLIDQYVKNASACPLHEIEGVPVTQAELDTITGLQNKVMERLAFTLLCLAKWKNLRNPLNHSWVDTEDSEIYRLARITTTAADKDLRFHRLRELGLIGFAKKNTNLSVQVLFVHEDSPQVLWIDDFRELGYEYLLWKGEPFIRCSRCGILTRSSANRRKKYCKSCADTARKEYNAMKQREYRAKKELEQLSEYGPVPDELAEDLGNSLGTD